MALKNKRREKTVPAREIEVKGKMEERTEWREQSKSQIGGEGKRSGILLGAAEPAKSSQNGACFSGKTWHTGPVEKKRVASVAQGEQLASTPEPFLPKGKGT